MCSPCSGGGPAHLRRRRVEARSRLRLPDAADRRVLEFEHRFVVEHLRVLHDLFERIHGTDRHVLRDHPFEDLARRPLAELFVEDLAERLGVLRALEELEARVVAELGPIQRAKHAVHLGLAGARSRSGARRPSRSAGRSRRGSGPAARLRRPACAPSCRPATRTRARRRSSRPARAARRRRARARRVRP